MPASLKEICSPVVVWHRYDLRVRDHQGLCWAHSTGAPVIPVFIYSPETEAPWALGAASRWWLHHSLLQLEAAYKKLGLKLTILRAEDAAEAVLALMENAGASELFMDRRFEPAILKNDRKLKRLAQGKRITVHEYLHHLLTDSTSLRTQQGNVYQVFTPFYKNLKARLESAFEDDFPMLPHKLRPPRRYPLGLKVSDLLLLPTLPWADGWHDQWQPGEAGAEAEWQVFVHTKLGDYKTARDRPAIGEPRGGTSRLSPHLRFGEIAPRRIYQELTRLHPSAKRAQAIEIFIKEMAWREFAHYLLFHFPESTRQPLRKKFRKFPWQKVNARSLKLFKSGCTGFVMVDAGIRQLMKTGWMHNRVRMIVASFLVKDLRYSWMVGARWFWDTLVDADLAANTLNWQWSAGCGADAAPYFRIFNPLLQAKRFDPDGEFVKRWLPEVGDTFDHGSGALPVDTYPAPMLDHAKARTLALKAFKQIK